MYVKGNLSGLADYNADLAKLTQRVNYNAGGTCRLLNNCYTQNTVHSVLQAYKKLVLANKIAEYGDPNSKNSNAKINELVGKEAVKPAGNVGAILTNLYYMTYDIDSTTDPTWLYPLTKAKTQSNSSNNTNTNNNNAGTGKKKNDVIIDVAPVVTEEPKKDLITTLTDNWYYVVGGLFGAGVLYKLATKKGK